MIVQIYEIQTENEAELVLGLGADHLGSVVVSEIDWKDPHIRGVIKLTRNAGKKSSLIPLFSDVTAISRCLDYYQPDIIHFCESVCESVDKLIEIQKAIRRRFPQIQIMRSIPISEPEKMNTDHVLTLAKQFEPYSDYFLTDTVITVAAGKNSAADQPVSGFVGITGKICDWEIAAKLVIQSKIPVILAGGLGPSNVIEAILKVKPFGVDSCSATNAQDNMGDRIRFKKDPEKVRQFILATRKAEGMTSIN